MVDNLTKRSLGLVGMGHAGAIVGGAEDTAQAKIDALRSMGIQVADSPADMGAMTAKALGLN